MPLLASATPASSGTTTPAIRGGWLVAALTALVEIGAAAWATVAAMLGGSALAAAS